MSHDANGTGRAGSSPSDQTSDQLEAKRTHSSDTPGVVGGPVHSRPDPNDTVAEPNNTHDTVPDTVAEPDDPDNTHDTDDTDDPNDTVAEPGPEASPQPDIANAGWPETVEGQPEPDDEPDDRSPIRFGLEPDAVMPLIAGASAIGAALSGQQPTGTPIADFALSALFGGAIAWAGQKASPQALLFAAAAVLFFSGFQMPAVIFAMIALVVAVAPMFARFDPKSAALTSGVAAALVAQAALNLPNIKWVATASVIAAVAVAPIIVSWWRLAHGEERRLARRGAVGAGLFAVIATVLLAIAGLWARGPVEQAITDSENGIDALQAADQAAATELLTSATQGFGTAHDRLAGPLGWPAKLVPIMAQHGRAVTVAAAEGERLAGVAVRTVTTADVDQIRGNNGSIDLDLVREVDLELSNANRTLRDAQQSIRSVRSPWLLSPLDDRLVEVEDELVEVLDDIDLANQATSVVPSLLGGDGPRNYLVLFVQPAEAREYGGFVGAYGLLTATEGQLILMESGSIDTEFGTGKAEFTNPGEFPEHYFNKLVYLYPQNLTGIADLTTIAAAAADLAPQWRDDPGFRLDGVMTLDPFAVAGMLELTGPLTISGRDAPLDSSNVADYLLRDQYLEFDDDDRTVRQDGLTELAATAFAELLSIEIPGPERLGAIFGPLARENRIAFTAFDDGHNALFERILLDADLPIVGEHVSALGIYMSSAIAGKLDAYTDAHYRYVVNIDPETAETHGELTITVTNEVPAEAPEYVKGLHGIDIDGDPWVLGANHISFALLTRDEFGEPSSDGIINPRDNLPTLSYNHLPISMIVEQGETRTLVMPTSGQALDGRYDLLLMAQPTAVTPAYELVVRVPDGWEITSADGATHGAEFALSGALTQHQPISLQFATEK